MIKCRTHKLRMNFLLGLLLLLARSCSAADTPELVFAQIGNSVTIPRPLWRTPDKIHVNWYYYDTLLVTKNPTSTTAKIVALDWQKRLALSPDFSLIISSVNVDDFGIFRCEQHELVNEHSTKYKLYEVTMSTPPTLLAGDPLSLSCEIDNAGFALVRPKVRWLGPDNKPYTGQSNRNRHTLRVNKVSGIHTGKWICELTYGDQRILRAMTDVVIVDLAPSPPDPIYTSTSSQKFYIPCSLSSKIPWSTVNATGLKGGSWVFASRNNPTSSVTLFKLHLNPSSVWVKTDILNDTQKTKNNELNVEISKVSVNDRGNYTCSLEFGRQTLSRRVQVEVLHASSSTSNIYAGDTVNLTCTLGHPMTPDLEVNWTPPYGASLPNLSPTHPTELSIPGVSIKHSGRWKCQLKKNSTVLTSAYINLKIEKAPVDIWLVVAIIGGVLVFIFLAAIVVIIIRRRRKVVYRRRKKRFCCCKNPQPKGFYRT